MDSDWRVGLASFLEGCDVVCSPSPESSLGISVFLFAHRGVVVERLWVRGRHPLREGRGNEEDKLGND